MYLIRLSIHRNSAAVFVLYVMVDIFHLERLGKWPFAVKRGNVGIAMINNALQWIERID